MRSWEARGDTAVCDEPLYAHYLKRTGLNHPGAQAIINHQEIEPETIIAGLTGPIPAGQPIFYQKHMAHHLFEDHSLDWLSNLTHAFLIRNPRDMIVSLAKVTPHPRLEDTGLPQQERLFLWISEHMAQHPPVLDSRDVLRDPPGLLTALCSRLGVPYTNRMLSWPPGLRETDGIWAKHWYDAVAQSTGFGPEREPVASIPAHLHPLLEACEPIYDRLHAHRLVAD